MDGGTRMAGWPIAGFVKIPGMTRRIGLTVAALAAALTALQAAPATVALVVTGGTVVTMDRARRVLPRGAVAIDGDRIVGVGTPEEIGSQFTAARAIDATGKIVIPGLVNTHGHAPMVLYRGLADDVALMEWLEKYLFPAEAKTVSPEMVAIGTRLAALEMIQSGTTTFADMYYFEEEIARTAKAAGLRAVLGQTIIRFPVADAKTPAGGAGPQRGLPQGVQRRPAHHGGRGAAFGVHARQGDAAGVPRSRDQVRRALDPPPGGDRRRGADPEGADRRHADRLPGVDWLLGAAHARGARASG